MVEDKLLIDENRIEFKKQHQGKEIWRRFKKDKGALVGLYIAIAFVLVIIFADVICPYETAISQDLHSKLQPPSYEHWFGTDTYGRDVFARIIHGARTSLSIALIATISSCVFGGFLGAVAGYYGGKIDSIIMRSLDIFMSVPDLLFTMAVVAALGASYVNLLIALTLVFFTNYVRLVRSQVLGIVEKEYVEASKAGGASNFRIILTHIIPNSMGVIIVNFTLNVAKIIIYEATLSFLGLGMPPPAPEWGMMLSEARQYMRSASYLVFFPAAAIVLSGLAVNFIGDGLRNALDPHLKS
ncbi:Glutathione transport system permease protein GsiD [bioreactor metagenome]|uniref:Glutathione transport system permease protein GsiD n=1 Tax=bioreactor metagenome TaxID=1076179 RepID=A0A645AHB7_9ZZZZ